MIEFGSVSGTLIALGLFGALFAALGWGVARAILSRTEPRRVKMAWVLGLALFLGPLALTYATSFGGFYSAEWRDSSLRLRYLIPGVTRDIQHTDIQTIRARPWYRGRWRLIVETRSGNRYESATDSREVIEAARVAVERLRAG